MYVNATHSTSSEVSPAKDPGWIDVSLLEARKRYASCVHTENVFTGTDVAKLVM